MNARNEMKKALEAFGKPLVLFSNGKPIRAVGLFDKIKTNKTKNHVFNNINSFYKEKFSLWAYDYTHVKSVDKIVCENETFEILSGDYDQNIGCWRLIVQNTKLDPIKFPSNEGDDSLVKSD